MKTIIILAIILLALPAFAGDPNAMPNPTSSNRITSCVQGNITYLQIYTPEANQQIVANASGFPGLIEQVFFRYLTKWIEELLDEFNSDMNIIEAQVARLQRDAERIR